MRMMKKRKKLSWERTLFFLIILLLDMIVLYPILNVIAVSFSEYTEYVKKPMMILPHSFSLKAYQQVFEYKMIWTGYKNTIFITVVGAATGVFFSAMAAYPLSKKDLKGRKFFMTFILITMFFNGGMIPRYFLVKNLHLIDTMAALILTSCISAYYIILIKNFYESLPQSLIEAARLDGATEPQVLFKIVIPLSKPIISVITLFLSVNYWNSYFNAILFSRSQEKWTLQLALREIIMASSSALQAAGGNFAEMDTQMLPSIMLQYASIVVVMLPILCVYPFIQKYFQVGMMMGAVKE